MKAAVIAGVLLAFATTPGITQPGGAASPGNAFGRPDAPVRIDLYSDYQCPACKTLHEQTLTPTITDYVNTGKVYLVHHEFPLPMHAHAREAALYACAAGRIGKYAQVADRLFKTQDQWQADGNVAAAALSVLSAAEADKVKVLVKNPEIAKSVDEDIRAGQGEKVSATPTMIITRLIRRFPVSGPVSYTVFRRFLDSLLT